MTTRTRIGWADWTLSVLIGCTPVSTGCALCYAKTVAHIRKSHPDPKVADAFQGLTERRDGRTEWTGRVNFITGRLVDPFTMKKPRRIFLNSMADLFDGAVTDQQIFIVIAMMLLNPRHTFQILTKRAGRMASILNRPGLSSEIADAVGRMFKIALRYGTVVDPDTITGAWQHLEQTDADGRMRPLPNAWWGVSVEDQKAADLRVPSLIDTPAAVRIISAEPLLGPVDLNRWMNPSWDRQGIHWIIVGAESGTGPWKAPDGTEGRGARPMHPQWARQLRDQAAAAGVPFFFKLLCTKNRDLVAGEV